MERHSVFPGLAVNRMTVPGVMLLMLVAIPVYSAVDPRLDAAIITLSERIPLTIQTAVTPEQWQAGLQGAGPLREGDGFLMIFTREQILSVSTADLPGPVDILFINPHHRILLIRESVPPGVHVACPDPGIAILVAAGGFCREHGIVPNHYFLCEGVHLTPKADPIPGAVVTEGIRRRLTMNVERYPDDCRYREWLAEFELYTGEIELASEQYTALERECPSAEVYNGLAKARAVGGDLESAETYFKQAVAMDPSRHDSYRYLLRMYQLVGARQRGTAFLEKFAAAHPEIPSLRIDLAREYIAADRLSDAEAQLELLKTSGDIPGDAHRLMGDIHLRRGDFRAAAESYLAYLQICPHDPHAADIRVFITVHLVRRAQLEGVR